MDLWGFQEEIHLVALHSYESSNPEDLNFQQGDKIKLLSKSEASFFYTSNIQKLYNLMEYMILIHNLFIFS